MDVLKAKSKKMKLSNQLQLKVEKYFDYVVRKQIENEQEAITMFDSMPFSLKKEVKIENYIPVIKNSA